MSALVKVVQTELLPITSILADTNFTGTAFDVSTKFAGTFLWDFAAVAATATPAATEFCIQASQKATGNDTWVNIFSWLSSNTASASLTVSAGGTVGVSTITLSSSLGLVNRYFFLKNGTLANSEWSRRIGQTGGGPYIVTVEDAFTNNQSAATGWTVADRYKYDIDFTSIWRVRVCVNNFRSAASNRDVVCRVALITADSIT